MDTVLNGMFFVVGAMVFSGAGLLLVRRYLVVDWLKRQHEVASYFFLMIGTFYAVLIAFAIFVVWTGFKEAGENLEHEANEIGDFSRLSTVMPEPLRQNIRSALLEYLNSVMEDEFPAMADGRESQRTWKAVQKLWNVYATGQPNNPQMQAYYAESLRHLNELSNRRLRLFTNRGTVPVTLWYLLCSGGIVLIVFTYLFGHKASGRKRL